MGPGQRLRRAIAARGFGDVADFARRMGVGDTTVRNQILRESIPAKRAAAYARALRVPLEWLLEGQGEEPFATEPEPLRPDELHEIAGEQYAAVPRFDLQASAGHGRELPSSPAVLHYHLFRFAWLRSVTPAPISRLAVIEVDGDSMEPALRSGDTVLVDQTQAQPGRKDGMYVLNKDGDLQVKRVSAHPVTGRYIIKSDNPAYESWSDIEPGAIDIVGRVIWIGRRL